MLRITILGLCVALGACGIAGPPAREDANAAPVDGASADIAQLGRLRAELERFRIQAFDKGAQGLESHGNVLYWKTYPAFAATLHRREGTKTIDYAFGIGAGDDESFHASHDVVVTAARAGGMTVYRTYDARATGRPLGEAKMPAPSDEQKWWPYAVSGSTVYVVTTSSVPTGAKHVVWSFTAGGIPAQLTTLEDTGMTVGELLDVAVDGSTMMVVESGRLWKVDLAAKHATSLHNDVEIRGAVSFDAHGVVWEDASGVQLFEAGSTRVRHVSMELKASPYVLNETYKTAHYFSPKTGGANVFRWNDWIVYTADGGLFAYDLKSRAITPVLLDVDDDGEGRRIVYTSPVALDDGTLFTVGLRSTSGAVGADGPVYATDLTKVLAR